MLTDGPGQALPLDLDAIQADDAQLDALAAARLTDDTEETFRLLALWCGNTRAGSRPELIDTDQAAVAIRSGRRRRWLQRWRWWRR